MNPQKSTKIHFSERLSEILSRLSELQLRFIALMQQYPTKKEAAEALGIKPNTVYNWPAIIDEALELIAEEVHEAAIQIRKRSLIEAIMIKRAGLRSEDEGVRQRTATEIIEWELGKATQRQEIDGVGEQPLIIRVVREAESARDA